MAETTTMIRRNRPGTTKQVRFVNNPTNFQHREKSMQRQFMFWMMIMCVGNSDFSLGNVSLSLYALNKSTKVDVYLSFERFTLWERNKEN